MNYYPFYNFPGVTYSPIVGRSLFSRIFGNFNMSTILNGTSKTLNFVNQAIPVVKQISPLVKNTKTMFKVMNEFKKTDVIKPTKKINNTIQKAVPNIDTADNNSPTFFV